MNLNKINHSNGLTIVAIRSNNETISNAINRLNPQLNPFNKEELVMKASNCGDESSRGVVLDIDYQTDTIASLLKTQEGLLTALNEALFTHGDATIAPMGNVGSYRVG